LKHQKYVLTKGESEGKMYKLGGLCIQTLKCYEWVQRVSSSSWMPW